MKTKHRSEYAKVSWNAEDVQCLRENWSLDRCATELEVIEKHLQDRLIELGWTVMGDLLPNK